MRRLNERNPPLRTEEWTGYFCRMQLNRIYVTTIFILCAFLCAQGNQRNFDTQIQSSNKAIESLRKEIEATRKRIEREGQKEQSTTKNITNLEKEISLLDRLLSELDREIRKTQQTVAALENEISQKENQLVRLQDRYAKRVVAVYKKGSLSPLEQIFSSTSWRQAIYRAKYLEIISNIDRKTQKQINALIIEISQQKLNQEAAIRKSVSLKREQTQEKNALRNKKKEKELELRKIRQNKEQLAELIQEKQAGVQQLEAVRKKLLEDKDRFEREERLRKQREALSARNFSELKGKLSWPAAGRVVANFGRQWNPKLKTTTENPGIDIKGKPGSPITAVMNGIIISITYIRGYGTTMIIDHGGGFYTVYSHVTNIQVNMDSEVRGGDVIANMGDSGSVNGSMLHFEIWGENKKLDPVLWLTKQ